MFKSILVPLFGNAHDEPALDAAYAIASYFKAHIDAMHIRQYPLKELARLSIGDGVVTQEFWEALEKSIRTHRIKARESFDEFCRSHNLQVLDTPGKSGESACWQEDVGDFRNELVARTRYHDLVVIGRGDLSVGDLGDVLIKSGRPLLLVASSTLQQSFLGTVAIGWKDTANSAHALTSAMPLLRAARQIVVLSVSEGSDNTGDLQSAEKLAVNLRSHGIEPEIRTLATCGQGVGLALVDTARSAGAGLLIMGGYGHSRAQEYVLGGVTRYMLETANFPVFLSH